MRPITFGGCFGWLHPALGTRGIVLCNAFGHEELCAHRAWRGLAERLAAAGLPTLRFDYHGTGDSVGSDEEPGRVRAWLDSVRAAEAWLRRETGVKDVALVGLRLGATLAAMAAQELGGVDALALLAPVVSGRTYARELKALMMAAPVLDGSPPPRVDKVGDIEVGGFVFSAETLDDLKRFDLLGLERQPSPRILLFSRSSLSANAKLAAGLRRLGCEVREEPFTGYDELMRDVNLATPPDASFELLVAWLVADPCAASAPRSVGVKACPILERLEMPCAIEEAVTFGDGGSLFGVCCTPPSPCYDRPAVLFLNTGANHHIGANRMAVLLGRQLAEQGITSFRIDIAGIGDSPARLGRPDNLLYADESCDDVYAALNWLEGQGFRRCVVVGVCCGAYIALRTAPADERIVGLVLVNPQRFVWHAGDSLEIRLRRSFHATTFYLSMARRPQTWWRMIRGEVNVAGILGMTGRRLRRRVGTKLSEARGRLFGIESENQRVMNNFAKLSARGVDILFVYGAADGGLDELETYFGRNGRKLKHQPNVRIEILQGADHTLAARWTQECFAQLLKVQLGLEGS